MLMELVGHTVAERYEVIEKLQSGYFGQTWLAVNKDSESYVCLKVGKKSCNMLQVVTNIYIHNNTAYMLLD